MLSVLFYLLYFLLILSTVYFFLKKSIGILYPLIITAQFNVTSLLKVGITVSFFELNLFLLLFIVLLFQRQFSIAWLSKIRLFLPDFIWIFFLVFSLISIILGLVRVAFGDLIPDPFMSPSPFIRGLMSLNKFFVFLPIFFVIRQYLLDNFNVEKINKHFLLAMIIGGILPSLAVIIQFLGVGFTLIHNNPSFSETFRIETYQGARPAGLTNEASFFAFQLFFSNLALFYAFRKRIINFKIFITTALLFLIGIILSISRLGQLFFVIFYMVEFGRYINVFSSKGVLKLLFVMPILLVAVYFLSTISIGGFNIGERFMSTFEVEADLSTIERYGTTQALFSLLMKKSLLVGIGMYNFQYYIKDYLPDYMDVMYYPKGVSPASFNFVLQMIVEQGVLLFLAFMALNVLILKRTKNSFIRNWYIYLFLFSISFQTLNFSIPFLIMFFVFKNEENSLFN